MKQILIVLLIGTIRTPAAGIDRSQWMTDQQIVDSWANVWKSDKGPREVMKQHQALAKWKSDILSIDDRPSEEQIELLVTALRKMSRYDIFQLHERFEIYDMAQKRVISIPGHAECIRDRVLSAQNEVKAHLDDGQTSVKLGEYYTEKSRSFEALSHLPSAENVRILGEFLSDEWTGDLSIQEGAKVFPLSHDAVRAFGQLPLIGKPFPQTEGYQAPEQLEGWRQWYQEIKSGKRTFRFEGDPTEYDLNGPAPNAKLERVAMHQRRENERQARHGGKDKIDSRDSQTGTKSTERTMMVLAMILAGVVSLVAMFRYFARSKNTKAL